MYRFAVLHLRSRSAPESFAAIFVLAIAAGIWARTLPSDLNNAWAWASAGILTAAAITPILGGNDVELERTAAICWRPIRFAHLGLGIVVCIVAVAVSAFAFDGHHTALAVRAIVGSLGLYAASVACMGTQAGWLAPLIYLVPSTLLTGRSYSDAAHYRGWLTQPGGDLVAWSVALAFVIAGSTIYGLFGPRLRAVD